MTQTQAGDFRQHLEQQLARIDGQSEDARLAILRRRDEAALREAVAWDTLAVSPSARPPLYGLTVAAKACFDVAGWPTTAGAKLLRDAPLAKEDAALVARLRANGAVVTSQTNMTEFAFGALGLNPHFGTPRTPLDPARERIAGGSTSGGAVAVALGFADLALGSDTSGSVRIPAAFCGLAAFKPSRGRYPDEGLLHLSTSFDVPGFLARDIETCARVDQAITGETAIQPADLRGRRFLLPPKFALDAADEAVTARFLEAVETLRQAGAVIVERDWPELESYGRIAVEGGLIVAEAFAWHQPHLESRAADYDPRVGPRIQLGKDLSAVAYIRAKQELARLAEAYHHDLEGFDALLTPTVPILPPRLAYVSDDEHYYPTNRLTFRMTEVANRIDAPSVSVPVAPGQPIGLMLTGQNGRDSALLALAASVEAVLADSHR